MAAMIDVTDLMDVRAGDERGTPDFALVECRACGVIFRRGGWHLCDGEGVEWGEFGAARSRGEC